MIPFPHPDWGSAVQISDKVWLTATFRTDTTNPTFWHWCEKAERWEASGTPNHTVVSTDPWHLEPSLLSDWCCGLHGWIREGVWVDA